MFRSSRRLLVATSTAVVMAASTLAAHGGMYRGGAVKPPDGGSGRPAGGGPTTPGPAGPTRPVPGRTGPVTPGPGLPPSGPLTGGLAPALADDSQWDVWWEFNKDPFLQLKRKVHANAAVTGSDDFELGRGLRRDFTDRLAPSEADVKSVLPVLVAALEDPRSSRDIVSACSIALARIGKDPSLLPRFRRLLKDGDQEKRETAALAMGISALPEAVPDLLALATGDGRGRELCGGPVDFRVQSFAWYGLGLVAYARRDAGLEGRVLAAAKTELLAGDGRQDVQVAAAHALRLLTPDAQSYDGVRLRHEALDFLLDYLDRREAPVLVQAHALAAIAGLAGRDPDGAHVRRVLAVLRDRGRREWLHQSAIQALGQMATPQDRAAVDALQDQVVGGRTELLRHFACIALGRIGGASSLEFLRARLSAPRTKDAAKPWLALGLAILVHEARARDASLDFESVADGVRAQLAATQNRALAAGLATALGILGDQESGDLILDWLRRCRNDDEPAGHFAVALGLMGYEAARDEIAALLDQASRREALMTRCAVALGLLGDKEAGVRLLERLQQTNPVAVFGSLAQSIGLIGDRRSIAGLAKQLADPSLQPLNRAFAGVALGLVCDKELLPWNSKIAVDANYRASVETLTGNGKGVLDIL